MVHTHCAHGLNINIDLCKKYGAQRLISSESFDKQTP